MSRPTDDILDDADNADTGGHGCLLPTGDAAPEDTEGDTADE